MHKDTQWEKRDEERDRVKYNDKLLTETNANISIKTFIHSVLYIICRKIFIFLFHII